MSHPGSINPHTQISIVATRETLSPSKKRKRIGPSDENIPEKTGPLPTFPEDAAQKAAPKLSKKKVTLIWDNYERVCRNNGSLYSGQAKLSYDDGFVYIDNFKSGFPNGLIAALHYPNGQVYYGTFRDKMPHGEGMLHYAEGEGEFKTYSGEFQNGIPHGFGKIYYVDGSEYVGQIQNGQPNGTGTLSSANGEQFYIGEFLNGKFHGYGKKTLASTCQYEGAFWNGCFHGRGKLTFPNGEVMEGTFAHDILRESDSTALGTARFIIELFGLPGYGSWPGESLGIIADFLENDEEYEKYAQPLREAHRRMQLDDLEEEAKKIHLALKENQEPQLLAYGTYQHAMGLNLVPEEDYVICEIFNSGEGTHKYHPVSEKKCQTMLQVKVPKTSLKKEVIYNLLNFHRSQKTTDEAYEAILHLPGATLQTPREPVWHSIQKGNNCGTKWILLYLDKMGPLFHKMRLQICVASIRQGQLNPNPVILEVLKDNAELLIEKIIRKKKRFEADEQKEVRWI